MTTLASSSETTVTLKSGRGMWLLVAAVLSSGTIGIDGSVVAIALPSIGHDFEATFASLQWTVVAYTVTLASLIVLGGRLGDAFGRRRVLVIGTVWFGLASIACTFAPSVGWLVAARALEGMGAALVTPAALAILESTFARSERNKVIAYWVALSGVAGASAPFIGGWLISAYSWRAVFLINIPLDIAVLIIVSRYLPSSRPAGDPRVVDFVGATLLALALGSLSFGLLNAAGAGAFTPTLLIPFVAAVVFALLFIRVERRSPNPMLPFSIFKSMEFSATNLATVFDYAALGVFFLLFPVFLEVVAGFSALAAGATLLPITVLMLALSAPSGALARRFGVRPQMVAGPLITAVGVIATADLEGPLGLAGVFTGVCLVGVGLATFVPPLTTSALRSAPDLFAGLASGVNNGVARTGSLLAITIVPIVSGLTGRVYNQPHNFSESYVVAMLMCASLLVTGAIAAAVGVPGEAKWSRRDRRQS